MSNEITMPKLSDTMEEGKIIRSLKHPGDQVHHVLRHGGLAADLARLADVKYEGRKAIVCLVGENLREIPGIAGRVFGVLGDVNIRMISQGASEINLTFVIEEDEVQDVIQRLHKTFFAELDQETFA